MIVTPGELAPGMRIAVIDGKELVAEESGYFKDDPFLSLSSFMLYKSGEPEAPSGMGRVLCVKAVNLPLVLAVDVLTGKGAVYDARKLQFREISKEFAKEYFRLLKARKAAK
jgi:hypothetical protein